MKDFLEQDLRALATKLAVDAGHLIRSMRVGPTQSKTSPTDLVTQADRAAEELIFETLRKERPEDSILAEEGSVQTGTSGLEWVVDPLDGTVNYVYGIPQWCISIGLEGPVRLGVIHDPNRDETFSDPHELHPSKQAHLAQAMIATGFSYLSETRTRQAEAFRRVVPAVRDIRRAGSCALDLAWVACGRLDGFYEEGVQRWDTSAGLALIEAAGGRTSVHGDLTIAAGNENLFKKLEELVLNAYGH